MRPALLLLLLLAGPALADDTTEIGHVNTALTNLGLTRSHRVVVERFTDPEVPGVVCHVSQARTGGIAGMVGVAEDPARFALACTATGPVTLTDAVRRGERGERVWEASTSFLFKETRVHRFVDEGQRILVYLAWSTRLIDGSPYNALATIPYR
ncbi:CreA family protein [Sediminicoccus rosea]|jgi:CreA protein|uniref:CreA family protein n=1 Tax=Sediminicoccus rosea TaxID=1225128 RepID=A0ABZ0PMF5_9PROT|nr:CreA family protein [Sediminicoccus rosea]WPB86647.1 CreA family protein [Sediminicoccus rosea]